MTGVFLLLNAVLYTNVDVSSIYTCVLIYGYSVSEDLDDVLQTVGVPKEVTHTSGLNEPSGDQKLEGVIQDVGVTDMQRDDILTYIECNTKQDSDLDLF